MAKIKSKKLTPVNPVVIPVVTPTATLPDRAFPSGTIKTNSPITGKPYGIPWTQISRWWINFKNVAAEWGIDPLDLAAMSVIESNGQHYVTGEMTGTKNQVLSRPDGTPVPSIGILQVKPQYHQWRVPNVDAYTPVGNMQMSAAILAQGAQQYGSIDSAILNIYFPSNDPNGTTQKAYLDTKRALVKEIAAGGSPPVVTPPVVTDSYRIIFGGSYPRVEYGFLDDAGIPSYEFVVNHGGTKATQHSGDDVPVPYGTKLFAPASGVVRCVGDSGTPDWGQSCGAYNDTGDAGPFGARIGVGNITILLDSGHKLTLGHCRSATVKVGQRVTPGQQVGTSGGQSGAHCHVEVSIEKNGTYWLVAPHPALDAAIVAGGAPVDTRPMVKFAGASVAVPLDVPFRIVLIPPTQRNQRPGTKMKPDRYVQHETGNPNVGADAAMHLQYLQNGALDRYGKPQQLGYHFTVDQDEIIQMIPLDEITWHGGDSGGPCNTKGIACELCVQDNNKYKVKARENAEKLAAAVMMAVAIDDIQTHGKCCKDAGLGQPCHVDCPLYIGQENYWPTFIAHVESHMQGGGTAPAPSYANAIAPPEFTGDDIKVNNVTFHALQRNFSAKQDGVPALQYADLKSSPVRAPLLKGEKFRVLYTLDGADGKDWLVTTFGSRIPAELCEPVVDFR